MTQNIPNMNNNTHDQWYDFNSDFFQKTSFTKQNDDLQLKAYDYDQRVYSRLELEEAKRNLGIARTELQVTQKLLDECIFDLESKETEIEMVKKEIDEVWEANVALHKSHAKELEKKNKAIRMFDEENKNLRQQLEALTMSMVTMTTSTASQSSASTYLIEQIRADHEDERVNWAIERESLLGAINQIQFQLESTRDTPRLAMKQTKLMSEEYNGELRDKENDIASLRSELGEVLIESTTLSTKCLLKLKKNYYEAELLEVQHQDLNEKIEELLVQRSDQALDLNSTITSNKRNEQDEIEKLKLQREYVKETLRQIKEDMIDSIDLAQKSMKSMMQDSGDVFERYLVPKILVQDLENRPNGIINYEESNNDQLGPCGTDPYCQ